MRSVDGAVRELSHILVSPSVGMVIRGVGDAKARLSAAAVAVAKRAVTPVRVVPMVLREPLSSVPSVPPRGAIEK